MQKEKIVKVVDSLPDEVDVDALMEKLYLLRKIEIGEKQLEAGQGIDHDEAKRRLGKWLE